MSSATKIINYRGGIVQFQLPAHWREEYEANGGGTFYDDRPNSGTLRLNAITAEAPSGMSMESAMEDLFPAGDCELISGVFPLCRKKTVGEEEGTRLIFYRWEIGVSIPPNHIRIICFTHTVLAALDALPETQAELAFVEGSVQVAQYSQVRGV